MGSEYVLDLSSDPDDVATIAVFLMNAVAADEISRSEAERALLQWTGDEQVLHAAESVVAQSDAAHLIHTASHAA